MKIITLIFKQPDGKKTAVVESGSNALNAIDKIEHLGHDPGKATDIKIKSVKQ